MSEENGLTLEEKTSMTPPVRPPRKPISYASSRRMGKIYPPEEKRKRLEDFAKLRAAGTGVFEAVRLVGISYPTLQKWAKEAGIPLPTRPKTQKLLKPASTAAEPPAPLGRPRGGPLGRPPKASGRKPGRPKGLVRAKPRGRPRGRPRAVRTAPPAPAEGLVLVTPQGQRFEGIEIDDLLDALRAQK